MYSCLGRTTDGQGTPW